MRGNSRGGRTDVGQLPLEIWSKLAMQMMGVGVKRALLEVLEALKGDFELVLVGELGGVVQNLDAQKRDEGHGGGVVCA